MNFKQWLKKEDIYIGELDKEKPVATAVPTYNVDDDPPLPKKVYTRKKLKINKL